MTDGASIEASLEHHGAGRLEEAEAGYRGILEREPDNVDAMQLLGVLRAQQGNIEEARTLLESAVEREPSHYAALDNLGNLRQLTKDFQGAAECYRKAADLKPLLPDAFYNLGVVCAKDEQPEAAAAAYEKVIALDPAHYNGHYNLAHLLMRVKQPDAAGPVLEAALAQWPDDVRFLMLQSDWHRDRGEWPQAASTLARGIALDPSRAHLQHLVDAYAGKSTDGPPDAYVQKLFDDSAKDFDARLLLNLEYQAPMMLSALLTDTRGEAIHFERLLDLGCGTGLSGVEFFEFADELHGVDLSDKMLARARAREIYTELTKAGIESYLQDTALRFDAFLAADVFVYVGNLEKIFALVAARATRGAHFLFSVEATDGDRVELRRTGRYAHPQAYIRQLAASNGFAVAGEMRKPLRNDFGKPVIGDYYLLSAGRK